MRKGIATAFLLTLYLIAGALVTAQVQRSATVKGRIVTQNGAPAVRVKIMIGEKWAYTDSAGRYVMEGIPYGSHRMILERQGQKVKEVRIEVNGPEVQHNDTVP